MNICPKCGNDNTYVVESRIKENGERLRRKECRDCGERFTTIEMYKAVYDSMNDTSCDGCKYNNGEEETGVIYCNNCCRNYTEDYYEGL